MPAPGHGASFVLAWWSPGLVFERWITAITLLTSIVGATVAPTLAVRRDAPLDDLEAERRSSDVGDATPQRSS